MFDGLSITQAIERCFDEAQVCIDQMLPLGEESSQATLHYRLAYKRVYRIFESSGMAKTSLDKMTKCEPEVAIAEAEMLKAQVRYDANHQQQLLWKKRGDYYRELAAREWSRSAE